MSDNFYLGEVRLFPYNFAPRGWVICDGSLLPISENQALFAVIGNYYGGDGRTTMGVPDLRGRAPIGMGQAPGMHTVYQLGLFGGFKEQAINEANMPSHHHAINYSMDLTLENARALGSEIAPGTGDLPANVRVENPDGSTKYRIQQYVEPASSMPAVKMGGIQISGAPVLADSGGNQSYPNAQPVAGTDWFIAVEGIFPPRN